MLDNFFKDEETTGSNRNLVLQEDAENDMQQRLKEYEDKKDINQNQFHARQLSGHESMCIYMCVWTLRSTPNGDGLFHA